MNCRSAKRLGNLCFAAILMLSLSALTVAPTYGEAIRIGMSAAFSGPTRGLGIELYRGSMAYLSQVNQAGGVYGRKIDIIPYDDGYNPLPTIKNTIELVESKNVFLLMDYVGTPTVTRMLPLLKKYSNRHMFLFFPFTGAQPHREYPYGQYVFNLRASYRQEIEALVNYLVLCGRRRIAVFYQIDAYGRSGWESAKRALAARGLKMVGEATYYRGAKYSDSMNQHVDILKAAQPDAIISVGAYAACAALIRDARDKGLDSPICNVSFVDSESLLKLLMETGRKRHKDYTKNLINSQVVPSYEEATLPAVAEYREAMKTRGISPPARVMKQAYTPHEYSPVSLEGFLNAKMIVEIFRRLGPGPDRSKIRRVVEGIRNYDIGINVPVSFGPDKRQGLDVVYLTTVEDGRFVPLMGWLDKDE